MSEKRSIFTRLYHGETNVDFIGRTKLWFAISVIFVIAGLGSLVYQGLNLGIDFKGGTAWEVPAPGVSESKARAELSKLGLNKSKIQILGGDTLRVQDRIEGTGETSAEKLASRRALQDKVSVALAKLGGVDKKLVSVNDVGPSWGDEISKKAERALIFFLIAISIYITLRFEWKMAMATLAALFHDIFVTVGVYSIFQFEVTPATVIAFLTILGYSIYDGIVVFDKIEENTRGLAATGRMTYGEMVNLSLNQTLMRSLNTSITSLLPIASMLVIGAGVLGASTLQEFALALLIGLGSGAYSSIFIASPILAILKGREPRYAAISQRIATRGPAAAAGPPLRPAAAGGAAPTPGSSSTESTLGPPARPTSKRPPPRPRKKGRRR